MTDDIVQGKATKGTSPKSSSGKPQNAMRQFMASAVNTTTRERIFFDRLAFDLKSAAARVGYHIHLYEPDVDRDGFDIILEDESTKRYLQLKAALMSSTENDWEILSDLLRPKCDFAELYGRAPVEAGRGGGVILIDIDDENENGDVSYSYTDFDIIAAIAQGYLVEKSMDKKGKEKRVKSYMNFSKRTISEIWNTERSEKLKIRRRQFIRLRDPNALLELIGLRSKGFFDVSHLREIYGHFEFEIGGQPKGQIDRSKAIPHFYHLKRLTELQQPKGPFGRGFSRFYIPDIGLPAD